MSEKKDVKYLNKDFGGFRDSLVEFSKVYFPSTYNDFNPTSPGMMFMEMAAYVGDVLSYYIDKQLQETMIMKAQEYKNVITIAQGLGYTPQITNPSFVDLDMYMVVPKIGTGDDLLPDYRYALTIKSGVEVSSLTDSAIKFQTSEDVVFSNTGSINAPEVTVYELEGDTPKTFLLKK